MKKFGKEFINKERKNTRIERNNDEFLDYLVRKKISYLNIDSISDEEYNSERLFVNALYHYSEMPKKFRDWYDKNILSKYNRNEFLSLALKELTYQSYNKNNHDKQNIIKSLKLTKLVEDILYNSREKNFNIKTKSGKYTMYPIASSYEEAMDNLGHCHQVTEEFARNNKGIDVVCGYYKDSLYQDRYHSVAINKKTNEVIDVAHNMRTDVDLYLNEFNYEILLQEEADEYFKNFNKLKLNNNMFKLSNVCNLLKYTINKQMKLQELNKAKTKRKLFR